MERDRSFDNEAFFAALDAERISRNMHWKTVASQAGVSASTLTRIGQGRRPDVDSFAALASWANLDPEDFFRRATDEDETPSPLSAISLLLRRDPNLSPDAATALDELVKATYQRLQQQR
jgi:transcriptional regulator with XRE-family HTH domain